MPRSTTQDIARAGLFTALLVVGALVSLPVGSVPFTLQVFVVLLAGMLLGPRVASLSVAAYLALGLVAPVYAGGASGLAVLFGPTGGYLWGFLPAVLVSGLLAGGKPCSVPRFVVAGLAGLLPVYVLGASWLAVELGLTARAAFVAGVAPFVWLDALKAIGAAFVAKGLVSLPQGLPASGRDQ